MAAPPCGGMVQIEALCLPVFKLTNVYKNKETNLGQINSFAVTTVLVACMCVCVCVCVCV